MRLTPLDIRKQEFAQRFRGYEPEEVDTFLDLIAEDVEKLLTDRNQLADRVAALEQQLNEFRVIEKSLRDALVMAEKMQSEANESAQRRADGVLREAEIRAQGIVGEGETRCREILAEAENRRRSLIMELEALESQRTYALNKFRSLLDDQRAVLEAHLSPRVGMHAVGGGARVVAMPPPGVAPVPPPGVAPMPPSMPQPPREPMPPAGQGHEPAVGYETAREPAGNGINGEG
jgi:DivIVA domain-containing protein